MKILLVCKGEYRYLFPAIAEALRQRCGASVSAAAFSSPTTSMLGKTGAFHQVFNLAGWLKFQKNLNWENCLETLRKLESLPHSARINTMVHADRILARRSEGQVLAILSSVVEFWKHVWDQDPPDAVVGEVACATEWIGWVTAREHGIPYFVPCPTPVANRFFFLGAPDGPWQAMSSAFLRLSKHNLTNEQSSAAEDFVQSFRSKKTKPPFLRWAQHSPLLPEFSRLTRRIKRIPFRIRTYLADGPYEIGSSYGTPPWQSVCEDALRIVRHVATETVTFKHRFDTRLPFVYFPLHVQPEFTTDVRAPLLTNQIAVIENISKSVPAGYQVLVKEHPGMKGERNINYYKQLTKLHNVRLLSPSIDSHDLIRAADAVLTITGSSAWEAILYEKPVIAFGPLYYDFYPLIYQCETFTKLPGILSQALTRFTPDHELLLKLVWALLESAHELEWADPIRQPAVTARHNCERIADAIAAEVSSLVAAPSQKAMLIYA